MAKPRMMRFSALAALLLGSALVTSSRLADAETGSSLEEGDLATLLEERYDRTAKPSQPAAAKTELDTLTTAVDPGPIQIATRVAMAALLVAGTIFLVALWVKRGRERRFGEELTSNLAVKDSVWVGRGQRVLLLTFENHKVLVGVSGGAMHNLGVLGEDGTHIHPTNPIERDAAMRASEASKTSEFADFVKGELAQNLGSNTASSLGTRDRRHKMLSELNSL